MDITWLGHSCFRIKGRTASVVLDPFNGDLGYPKPSLEADLVTISHDHPHHAALSAITGTPRYVVRGPGEYEIAGIFVTGVRTYHDKEKGKQRGKNTIYLIDMEEMKVCHLGDLGHVLTSQEVADLSGIDVVMVPVGGVSTLDAAEAVEVIAALTPKLVIPMHYRTEVARPDLEPLDRFLKEMGIHDPQPQSKLTVTAGNLPHETKVVLLDYPR